MDGAHAQRERHLEIAWVVIELTPRLGSTPAIANNVAGQTILARPLGHSGWSPRNPVRLTEISAGNGASQRK